MKKNLIVIIFLFILIFSSDNLVIPGYSLSATSMDVNDFESTMSIGAEQTISVVLYPEEAEDDVIFNSSNTSVATISPNGKISAKAAGTTNITITAGELSEILQLTVEPIKIEISDFEEKMSVGGTQTINAELYPSGAKDKIYYSSSDTAVATITDGGKIEAKKAGTTEITVSAGSTSKKLKLTVSVDTKGISLSSTYITLRIGQTYSLNARVYPDEAKQSLTYRSSDTSVIEVDDDGIITATGHGSASVIVSNGDFSTSANVIVNSGSTRGGTMTFNTSESSNNKDNNADTDSPDGEHIDQNMIHYLKKTGNVLSIEKDDYVILIEGKDIVNDEIILNDELNIVKNKDGYSFSLTSNSEFLPGEITIRFRNPDMKKCSYVYLKSSGKDDYKLFGYLTEGEFRTDVAGSYKITYEKIQQHKLNKMHAGVGIMIMIMLSGLYLLLKKI